MLQLSDPSLNTLLGLVGTGDAQALRTLYERLSPQLFALALRMLKDAQAAEDVLQDVFMTIWREAHRFQPELGSAAGWVTVIARNKCLDRLRARIDHLEPHEARIDELADNAPDPFEQIAHNLDAQRIRLCLEELTSDQRNAIVLTYFDGMTNEAVAARLGAPVGTVKSWIRRSLQSLRGCLER